MFDRLHLAGGLESALKSKKRVLGVLLSSATVYILLTLSSFPAYSVQMLGDSILYLDNALLALNANVLATAGLTGIGLSIVYSAVSGVFIVNLYSSVKLNGVSGMVETSGMLPAFVAGGCAGCGAGFLGFLGLLGLASALPFNGNGLKLGSIILVTASLAAIGDPELCDANQG
ncbi:MAG: hypothetical protein SVV03_05370 [Candidatus Nanohaloarchaea archaeon]|nr:hypothetical protein [Candidatus Nanohaloarchaea archaeon]